jgi:hypothetical protein
MKQPEGMRDLNDETFLSNDIILPRYDRGKRDRQRTTDHGTCFYT